MDIHVEFDSMEHYQRWLEEDGLIPAPVKELSEPMCTAETSGATPARAAVIRGQSPTPPTANPTWWVRPAVDQQPTSSAYEAVRGQTPRRRAE